MIGALLTFVLMIAVLMLIVCALIWALAAANGNHAAATKARIGALDALGAAVLAGGGVAWLNWIINLGRNSDPFRRARRLPSAPHSRERVLKTPGRAVHLTGERHPRSPPYAGGAFVRRPSCSIS